MRQLFFAIVVCFMAKIAHGSEPVTWQRAIDRDDIQALWRLLPESDVLETNEKGKTALMSAVRLGDVKLYSVLKEKGLTVDDRSSTGGTVLMYAALGNQLDMIRSVVEERNDQSYLNAQSTNGWTALMIASAKGFQSSVKLLVELGADPALADAYQWSPLMRAIDNRHGQVVRYLLSLPDFDLNAVNENGATALHVAVLKEDAVSVALLLKAGITRSIKDSGGATARDIAVKNGYQEILKLLESTE